jgi:hypothetical protein
MSMKPKDKEKLIEVVEVIVNDLAKLPTEKERMESLKDFTRIVQTMQPIASALVFEEKTSVRDEILFRFKQSLDKARENL